MRIYKRRKKTRDLKNTLKSILDRFPDNRLLDDIDDDNYTGRRSVTLLNNKHFTIKEIREYRKVLK